MRFLRATIITIALSLSGACTMFQAKQPAQPPVVPKKLAVPVSKHWQVMEEAPTLTNERNEQTLPFQTEQSVQPPGAPPVTPSGRRQIETPK